MPAHNIVLIVHYFPPINSSGAKRMEALSKYLCRAGRNVTVITTTKSPSDGEFSETMPDQVEVLELNWKGKLQQSVDFHRPTGVAQEQQGKTLMRRTKDLMMHAFGQLPDPRLPFAISLLLPKLNERVAEAITGADIIVATTPPWPPLLAAIGLKKRYGKPVVLDYRDQFSMCHEMPGSRLAKALEVPVDRYLARRADAIVAISEPMAAYYRAFHDDVSVILNGYDPEPLDVAKSCVSWSPRPAGAPVIVRYLGLVSEGRVPRAMLAALDKLVGEGRLDTGSALFEFYGEGRLLEQYLQEHHSSLLPLFKFLPRVSYAESLELAVTADHLLFCENSIPPKPGENSSANGILTTKLFEYLASGRPILADISPQTLAGSFAVEASNKHFVSNRPVDFEEFLVSERFYSPRSIEETPFVAALSRARQSMTYLSLLDSVVERAAKPAGTEPVQQR